MLITEVNPAKDAFFYKKKLLQGVKPQNDRQISSNSQFFRKWNQFFLIKKFFCRIINKGS